MMKTEDWFTPFRTSKAGMGAENELLERLLGSASVVNMFTLAVVIVMGC